MTGPSAVLDTLLGAGRNLPAHDSRPPRSHDGETAMPETSPSPVPDDDVDPRVAELVMAIRDRFGLRGLRGAQWMIEKEIVLAEQAISDLAAE